MKKSILFFILLFLIIFVLASCNNKEAVLLTTKNKLSSDEIPFTSDLKNTDNVELIVEPNISTDINISDEVTTSGSELPSTVITEIVVPVTTDNLPNTEKFVTTEPKVITSKETTPVVTSSKTPDIITSVGGLPECDKVDSSYFDDAVFIGDSVTLKLKYYETSKNVLGKCEFLTAGSFGTREALKPVSSDSTHPVYNGKKMLLEDSVKATGKHRVYIMLGMNDIAIAGIDKSVKNMEKVVDSILAKTPDALIYIQSMTPRTHKTDNPNNYLCNKNIGLYNKGLLELCEQRGWYFVDVASVMFDSKYGLKEEYCSDKDGMGIHFTESGCKAWVDYLYTHAYDPSWDN